MAPVKKPDHSRHRHFMYEWRKHRDKSQEAVADAVEIDRTTYSKIERGKLPYNQDFLERLAVVFRCEPADILSVDPTKPQPPKLVWSRLEQAPEDVRTRIMSVIDALLKAG
jgi:transcriptional regulator with XRE-family HTH domain